MQLLPDCPDILLCGRSELLSLRGYLDPVRSGFSEVLHQLDCLDHLDPVLTLWTRSKPVSGFQRELVGTLPSETTVPY